MTRQVNVATLRIGLVAVTACVVAVAVAPPSAQAQARGQGAPATRGCNLPEPFPCPVARLVELTAEPATINPGESARITWAAENPSNMTLDTGDRSRVRTRHGARHAVSDDDLHAADGGRAGPAGRHPVGHGGRAGHATGEGGRKRHPAAADAAIAGWQTGPARGLVRW